MFLAIKFHDQAICLPFSVKITPDNPPFCWVQRFGANSAFNIPAVDVAFFSPLLIWKLFDIWSQSAVGFLWWVLMENGIFFMNQRSVRLCGSKDSTSSLGRWDVCGPHLFCGGFLLLMRAAWLYEMIDQTWRLPEKQNYVGFSFFFYVCYFTLHCVWERYHWLITHRGKCVFVTVCCCTLQHSLNLIGWLL